MAMAMLQASVLAWWRCAGSWFLVMGPILPKRSWWYAASWKDLAWFDDSVFAAVAGGYFRALLGLYTFWMLVPLLIGS